MKLLLLTSLMSLTAEPEYGAPLSPPFGDRPPNAHDQSKVGGASARNPLLRWIELTRLGLLKAPLGPRRRAVKPWFCPTRICVGSNSPRRGRSQSPSRGVLPFGRPETEQTLTIRRLWQP